MRPIDAELLKRTTERLIKEEEQNGFYPKSWDEEVIAFKYLIDSMPTTEAKPVVYCKDCKYNVANSKHEPLDITDYTDITCEYFMTDGMSPNDFCSQGVKIPVISIEDVPKIMEEMEK